MKLALWILLAQVASAELVVYTTNGATEIPAGSSVDFGRVAQGDTKDVRFRLRNTSQSALSIANVSIAGANFRVSNRPSLPFLIPATGFIDILISFEAGPLATYTANLTIATTTSVTIGLLGTSVPAAVFSVVSGCTLAAGTIDFGRPEVGQTVTCNFSLRNPGGVPLTVTTLSVTGNGFQGPSGAHAPFTLAAGETAPFDIAFTPSANAIFAGTLAIDTRTYALAGVGLAAPLQAPILELDRSPQSAQQPKLTMRLPSPASAAVSGFVNLAFASDASLVTVDPTVVFAATGARTVPFTIRAGDTQATLGGQTSAVVQTGTTAGRITLTLSGVSQTIRGDATATFTIPAAPVGIDVATGGRRVGNLDVQVVGFDNTYSAGAMKFTFYDTGGRVITPISADFTSDFRSFFTRAQQGSTFRVLVTFPVQGDVNTIGAVDVELQNSTGRAAMQHIAFP